jgi:hypothetical protein
MSMDVKRKYKMYINPLKDQSAVRKMAADYMLINGVSRDNMAKKVGVASITISRFIEKGLDIKIEALSKIRNYLEKEHNEHSGDNRSVSE